MLTSSGEAFVPAATKEEAEEYFTCVLGLVASGYRAMHLDVANMVNKEIRAVYDTFGNIHESGFLEGVRVETYLPSDWIAAYNHFTNEVILRKRDFTYKASLFNLGEYAQRLFDKHYWSTNRPEHVIRHELGHAIGDWLVGSDAIKYNAISVLRNQAMKDSGIIYWDKRKNTTEQKVAAGKIISHYALLDAKEFVAESIAEYMAGNMRETARKVVEILRKGR